MVDFACGEHHVICLTASGQLFEWGDRSWLEAHPVLPPQVEDEDFHRIVKVAAGGNKQEMREVGVVECREHIGKQIGGKKGMTIMNKCQNVVFQIWDILCAIWLSLTACRET